MKNLLMERIGPAVVLFTLLALVPTVMGQDLAEFEKCLTEFTLDNGIKFLVLERHEAPVVACHTHVNVGAVDEVKGITGLAHLLEHMAFKGTKTIGTKDYKAEAKLMAKMDEIFQVIKFEQRKGNEADEQRLGELHSEFKKAQQEAQELLVHDEFKEAFRRAGCVGLNARTNYDSTVYLVSLPSNKLELWMLMESDRFLNPVLREFYKERDVVMEERRLRTESQPVGRLGEEFLAVAYKAHPYGEPAVGHMSDLKTLTRIEAQAFFNKYYGPSNLTIALVGDVNPNRVEELAQAYFGRIPYRPQPDPVETVEPPQLGERRVVVEDPAQPIVMIGYHKPSINHPDNAVFDAITDIMGIGRTSRLYKSLVKEKKIAMYATGFQGRPGNRYPGLFVFYAVPARNHTNEECEEVLYAEIKRLKNEPVSDKELEKAKTRARAGLIRRLSSNSGLARHLTFYETITGNWQNIFKQLDQIEQVTAADILRVARTYFTTKNRTIGMIKTIPMEK